MNCYVQSLGADADSMLMTIVLCSNIYEIYADVCVEGSNGKQRSEGRYLGALLGTENERLRNKAGTDAEDASTRKHCLILYLYWWTYM